MNIYDLILRDNPASVYQFSSQASSFVNLMGDSNALVTPTRTRTNLSLNPRGIGAGLSFQPNNTHWTVATNQASPGSPPLGLTFSAKSTVVTAASALATLTSLYNVDGQGNSATSRGAGLWVYSAKAANASLYLGGNQAGTTKTTAVLANNWTWVSTAAAGTGYLILAMTLTTGVTVNGDAVYITGVIAEAATVPENFFDGASTNTAGVTYAWTGAVNGSTSTKVESSRIYPGSMISGPGKSLELGNGWYAQYTFKNRFNQAYDKMPFSVEIMVKFFDLTPARLSSHTSSLDGIYFDGDNIEFSVDLTSGASASVLWPVPDLMQNYHVIGTYNGAKVSLYVDGVLIGSADIPDGDTLASKATDMVYLGLGAGPLLVEAPAFYSYELSEAQVASHFRASRQNVTALNAVSAYGGRLFTFMDDQRDVLFRDTIDWATEGLADNVQAAEYLRPLYGEDDLSQAGTFTFLVNSADTNVVTVYAGVKLEWNGDGNFTVEVSANSGTTWATVTNGIAHPNTFGMTASIPPIFRVTFAAGRAKNLDVVRNMLATVYSSLALRAVNDAERGIIFVNSTANTSSYWAEPIEMDDGAGSRMNNAVANLNESTDIDLTNIGTVEFWVKMNSIGGNYVFDARGVTPSNPAYLWVSGTNVLGFPTPTIAAVYVNGVAVANNTFVPVAGRWYHIVVVWTTPFNSKLQILAGASQYTNQYNLFAHYEAQLTAAQVLALYNSYFGIPALAIADANTIVVSETAPASKVYVNDWSITGAG